MPCNFRQDSVVLVELVLAGFIPLSATPRDRVQALDLNVPLKEERLVASNWKHRFPSQGDAVTTVEIVLPWKIIDPGCPTGPCLASTMAMVMNPMGSNP